MLADGATLLSARPLDAAQPQGNSTGRRGADKVLVIVCSRLKGERAKHLLPLPGSWVRFAARGRSVS